jgi:hypothetical protein
MGHKYVATSKNRTMLAAITPIFAINCSFQTHTNTLAWFESIGLLKKPLYWYFQSFDGQCDFLKLIATAKVTITNDQSISSEFVMIHYQIKDHIYLNGSDPPA